MALGAALLVTVLELACANVGLTLKRAKELPIANKYMDRANLIVLEALREAVGK